MIECKKGKVVEIPLAILKGVTHKKLDEKWLIALEALKKDIDDPDYQWVFEPIDLEKYNETDYKIFNGQHRAEMHFRLGLKKIRGKIRRDYFFDIEERRAKRQAYILWKSHKCQNCKNLRALKKGRKILVNENEKLCFFQCKTKGDLMDRDDLFRVNDCRDFSSKQVPIISDSSEANPL